jgi:hypothetical protein
MADYFTALLSPNRIHERACQLTGHRAYWHRTAYRGGLYSTEHFRTCSFCGSIHPGDLLELLNNGGRLVSSDRPDKFYVFTPNPVAGELVQMGSLPGPVFEKEHWPQRLAHRLYGQLREGLPFEPSINERLSGHFERAVLIPAPAEIKWPLYSAHVNDRQWPAIWAASKNGDSNEEVPSA